MKKLLALLLVLLAASVAPAAEKADPVEPKICTYCGMARSVFAHTRMLVEYHDGARVGTCSLHCTALDMANNLNYAPVSIMVADYPSHEMIDAQTAHWVVGGKLPGVMSTRGKWAFDSKAKALKFIAESGGSLVGFEEALKGAYEDMYKDTLMIREKRKAKMMQTH